MLYPTALYACLWLAAINAEESASGTISPENPERDETYSGCILPEQPIGGGFELYSCIGSPCDITPGSRVPSGSLLIHRCEINNAYVKKAHAISSCLTNEWHPPPTCNEFCPALNFKGIDARCSFQGKPVSCDVPAIPGTKATLACKESHKILPSDFERTNREITCLDVGMWSPTALQCNPVCGVAVPRERDIIVNGYRVEHGSFPWHVAIYKRISITNLKQICAGSLISTNFVISAAHCFFDETVNKVMDASEFSVVAGKYYRLYNVSEYYSQESAVRKIDVALGYSGASQNYEQDIALVHLETPFVMTTLVRPVCMDWYNDDEGEHLRIRNNGMTAWWGRTTDGNLNDKLQEVPTSNILSKDCFTTVPENFQGFVTADKFCARHSNGSRSCTSDSGSGLYFQFQGFWYLRGITSMNPMFNGTCYDDSHTTFTNIGHVMEWIRDVYVTTGNGLSGGSSCVSTCGANCDHDSIVGEDGGCPWRQTHKRYSEELLGLHEEIEDFFSYMSPSREELRLRSRVIQRLEEVVVDLWPNSTVEVFGSYRTGLSLPTSDIDLTVTGTWNIIPLRTLTRGLLDRNITEAAHISVVDEARVPIVGLIDRESKIKVDISFDNDIHDHNISTELIETYKHRFPMLEKVVMVLKQYLDVRGLNKSPAGGIPSYVLVLMTISFFQHRCSQTAHCSNANSGVLLIEFLELYGKSFWYDGICISVRNGGAYIPKEAYRRDTIDGYEPPFLCIEDPIRPERDYGHGISRAKSVKEAFHQAYEALSPPSNPLGKFVNNANRGSILGRIVRVKDDVVEYRKWVTKTFPLPPGETDRTSTSAALDGSSFSVPVSDANL